LSRSTSWPGSSPNGPALDVHRAKLFGRCDVTIGIAPFDRLVTQVMTQSPYQANCAERIRGFEADDAVGDPAQSLARLTCTDRHRNDDAGRRLLP